MRQSIESRYSDATVAISDSNDRTVMNHPVKDALNNADKSLREAAIFQRAPRSAYLSE